MYKNYFKIGTLLLSAITIMTSCKKNIAPETEMVKEINGVKGIYVLCEGAWGANNSTISYYDIEKKTVVVDYYKQVNGIALGETASDLKTYGSKMYCVVSGTQGEPKSFLDVMNTNTGKTIKRISFNTTNDGYMPRSISFYKDKAYVSRYDGKISRIDTASLTIDAELQLKNGNDNAGGLEGLAVANGKLYVANSDHFSYPKSLKNKVTVIDLATFTKTKDITVVLNPVKTEITTSGDLLVVSAGNYKDIEPALQKINTTTDMVTGTYALNVGAISSYNSTAYLALDWGTKALSFDLATGTLGNSIIKDNTKPSNIYGITANPYDQSVVIADAVSYSDPNGIAYVIDKDGKAKYSFKTGQLPQHAVFNYTYKNVYRVK